MEKKSSAGSGLFKRSILIPLSILLSALTSLSANAGDWQTYTNTRFGTTTEIPAHGFTAEPASQNGDGQSWTSEDGRGQILVFGKRNERPVHFRPVSGPNILI
jgi:hypothetical protein